MPSTHSPRPRGYKIHALQPQQTNSCLATTRVTVEECACNVATHQLKTFAMHRQKRTNMIQFYSSWAGCKGFGYSLWNIRGNCPTCQRQQPLKAFDTGKTMVLSSQFVRMRVCAMFWCALKCKSMAHWMSHCLIPILHVVKSVHYPPSKFFLEVAPKTIL